MSKIDMNRYYIFVCFAVSLFASCASDRDDPKDDPYLHLESHQKEFAEIVDKYYGDPSANMTWKTVKPDTVSVNMSKLSGSYTVQFYTDDPTSDSQYSYVLAEYKDVKGGDSHTLFFDVPIGLNYAYVSAISAEGKTYSRRFSLKEKEKKVTLGDSPDVSWTSRPNMHYFLLFESYNTSERCDFDYNEVVLDLEYVRGWSNIIVKLCAAGSSYHTSVGYRRETTKKDYRDDVIFVEVHEALGYPAVYNYSTGKNVYTILNTGLNETGKTVTKDFSLGEDVGLSICEIASKFHMYMKFDDTKKEVVDFHLPEDMGSHCPEAILVSVPDYSWTPEGMNIHVQYSRFPYWVAYPEEYSMWYTKVWQTVNEAQ